MKNLSSWALKNQKLISFLLLVLSFGGLISYRLMPKYEDPEIVVRVALVVGVYPGASAHQVELELADPLEKAIMKVDGVEMVQTLCYPDMSLHQVTLALTVPQDKMPEYWQKVRNAVSDLTLPSTASVMVKDDFGDVYGMFYSVSGDGMQPHQMEPYVDMLQRELLTVKNVRAVNLYGLADKCINISLRQDKLNNMGISPAEVVAVLNGQNATMYSGYFLSGDHRIRVSVNDKYKSAEDIRNLILRGKGGELVRLGDLADVQMVDEKPVRSALLRDGNPAVGLMISAKSGSDIIKVGKAVEEKLAELQASRLPSSIQIEKVFNQPDRVSSAIGKFLFNLLASVLMVVLILMICMNFRSGVILGATLLITVLGSLFVLRYFNGTIQRVSLASFIFAMGMLVDNAIVIIDGIGVDKKAGKSKEEALTAIGGKVAWPLLGATLIAVLSFLPIFLSPDLTGLYVRDMFIVLSVSLLISWLLALTLVPVMASRYLFKEGVDIYDDKKPARKFGVKLEKRFEKLIHGVLDGRGLTLVVMLALLVLTGHMLPDVKRALFPDLEYDQVYMQYKLPEGVTEDRVRGDLEEIRKELQKESYIKNITVSTGQSPDRYCLVKASHLPSLSYGELIIDFTSERDVEKHLDELQKRFSAKYPEANLRFLRYNLMFMEYPVQLILTGPDPAVLHNLHDMMESAIAQKGCLVNMTSYWDSPVPVLVADYDQGMARRVGASRLETSASLMAFTDGIPVGSFTDGSDVHNIYLHLTDAEGKPLQDMNQASVFGLLPDYGKLLDKGSVAEALSKRSVSSLLSSSYPVGAVGGGVNVEWEESVVPRYNGKRMIDISGDPAKGLSAEKARQMMIDAIAGIPLPAGYSIEWFGEKKASDMSMENLFNYYPIAILLIFVILLLLFRSYRAAILLFLCIPFVFIGVIPAVVLSGETFGFVTIVGILGLVGMVVKNGIVLLDEIKIQEKTLPLGEALVKASCSRLRPVTLTSLTTILGMVPLLFDAMFRGMAAALIGGLIAGTIVVLVLIPALYSIMFSKL